MNTVTSWIRHHPLEFAGIAALIVLGAAFTFQAFGYAPCPMCWWQRYPYMAIIPLGILGFILSHTGLVYRMLLALSGLLFTATAAIGAFHVGVEQKWWEGPSTCSSGADLSGDISQALDAILSAPVIRCDEIAWSLFGISMAGYNALIGFTLAGLCFYWSRNGHRGKT